MTVLAIGLSHSREKDVGSYEIAACVGFLERSRPGRTSAYFLLSSEVLSRV